MINITLIGFGNMGQAFYQGLKTNPNFKLNGQDRSPEKLSNFGLNFVSNKDLEQTNYLILGIKPQGLSDFKVPPLNTKTIIISMLAGTSIVDLKVKFMNNKIVRCMPNLAIKNFNGVTGWYGENLSQTEINTLNAIFECFGSTLQVQSETMLDHLTLISGSGPGYLAYIAYHLEQEAVKLGFSKKEAQQLVTATVSGTADLLQQQSAASLIAQVSSKKGVTEGITQNLDQNQFPEILHQALNAGLQKINDLKN